MIIFLSSPVFSQSIPTAITLAPTNVVLTGATLQSSVNPNGQSTLAWFEFGTTTNLGTSTLATDVGSGSTNVPFNFSITDLQLSTVYYYRVAASNASGVAFGTNMSFSTAVFTQSGMVFPGFTNAAAAWGDYDNDGDLDLFISGKVGTNNSSQLWSNRNDGTFAAIDIGLRHFVSGSVAWGDYDNDGFLDLVQTGTDGSIVTTRPVWGNVGNGTFTNFDTYLSPVRFGAAVWGDGDNDGRRDILQAGDLGIAEIRRNTGTAFPPILTNSYPMNEAKVAWADMDNDGDLDALFALNGLSGYGFTMFYVNNGNNNFTALSTGLPGLKAGAVAWGDYDNDGDLDLLISGNDYRSGINNWLCQLWENMGNGTFTNTGVNLPRFSDGSVAWGDYDNDGLLDMLLAGSVWLDGIYCQVWRNTGNGFVNINANLPEAKRAIWGDVNNDGRLDILLYGKGNCQIFYNVAAKTNSPPTAPSGLMATVNGTKAFLKWTAASDAQTTNANALTYNLRVGTSPGSFDIVSPQSSSNGWRRLPEMGSQQHGTSAWITNLVRDKTYYWSVQAVDTAFAGSEFSAEGSFYIYPDSALPLITSLGATNITGYEATLNASVNANGYDTHAYFEYGLTTNYGSFSGTNFIGAANTVVSFTNVITSLLTRTSYHYRVVANSIAGSALGTDTVFTTLSPPLIRTQSVVSISRLKATFQGQVNPNSLTTGTWFEYGPTNGIAILTPATFFSGTFDVGPSRTVTNLTPDTTYIFRIAASNRDGIVYGGMQTFTTLPMLLPGAVTSSPTGISAIQATLRGTVSPNGGATVAWFEYGLGQTNVSFNQSTMLTNLMASETSTSVSMTVSNLGIGQRYSFRLMASNSAGLSISDVRSFTTSASPPTNTIVSATAVQANGVFSFSFMGYSNRIYQVFGTTNLATWELLGTATQLFDVPFGTFEFSDADATNQPQRFYQLRFQP